MHSFPHVRTFLACLASLLLAACPGKPPVLSAPISPRVPPVPIPAAEPIAQDEGPAPEIPDLPVSDPQADPSAIERRFLLAPNDPAVRIGAVRELAHTTPAAALTSLLRLFPVERREDVKSEMLAVLTDLDHTRERDNQFALCLRATAPGEPQRIRYLAIHTLADLRDPRARALLLSLQADPDGEIRAAATRVLRDSER